MKQFQHVHSCMAKFLFGLLVIGCLIAPSSPARAANEIITILGGSPGGTWAMFTEGLAECLRRSMPNVNITTEPGKDGPNQVLVGRNEIPFSLAHEALTVLAIEGTAPFKEKLSDLRSVMILQPETAAQIVIDADTGLTSIADIKEKKYPFRICVNREGTMMDIMTAAIFEAYGFTYKDLESWGGKAHKIPAPEAFEMWDAGLMDSNNEVGPFPVSRLIEHGQKHALRLLPIDKDKAEAINAKLGTSSIVIPANSYPFQPEDVNTIYTRIILCTNVNTPDATVRNLLNAVVENLDYLQNVHVSLKDLSPKTMSEGLAVELHPAAAQFYKEALEKEQK